jgi:tetratricopeptide (TPR) repeat protein
MIRHKIILSVFLVISTLFSTYICYSENTPRVETQYTADILKYEKDLVYNRQDPELYRNLGKLYYAIGEKKKAIEGFQNAKRLYLDQGNIEAALQLETTLGVLSFSEAIEEIEKRIKKLETEVKGISEVIDKR